MLFYKVFHHSYHYTRLWDELTFFKYKDTENYVTAGEMPVHKEKNSNKEFFFVEFNPRIIIYSAS